MKKRDRGNGGVKGLREREQQAANHLESKAAGGLKKTLRNRVFATLQGKKKSLSCRILFGQKRRSLEVGAED